MVKKSNIRFLFSVSVLAIICLAVVANAKRIPAKLSDPDGKPGNADKPVKVYILAGQSNMVGFGRLSGAKNAYDAIYLTPDKEAPKGQLYVYRGGNYKVLPLD